jgi:hypothetical protein
MPAKAGAPLTFPPPAEYDGNGAAHFRAVFYFVQNSAALVAAFVFVEAQ